MKKKLLALAFGLLVAIALLEGGVRLVARFTLSPAEQASLVLDFDGIPYRPHPYVNWENKPKQWCREGEYHNEQGFRGPLRPVAKPSGVYRIVCLGGSTTYTQRVKESETYPVQLEVFLKERFPGRPIEVLNAGVKGYTSAESLQNLAFKVLDFEPDLIIVYHAVNDFYPRTYPGFRPDYQHCRVVWVEEDVQKNGFLRALETTALFSFLRLRSSDYAKRGGLYYWIYDPQLSQIDREQALVKSTTGGFEDNLRAICDVANGRGITCVLASQAQNLVSTYSDKPSPVPLDQMNDAARRVALEKGVTFLDPAAGFPQEAGHFSPNDLVHMEAPGARELARRIGQGLVDAGLLDRSAPRASFTVLEPSALEGLFTAKSPLPAESLARLEGGEIVAPKPYYGYGLVPGAKESPGLGGHDEYGRRIGAIPTQDGASPRSIVCLGGASTYGFGLAANEAWPARLQSRLRERGLARFVVWNCGVPGYTTAETLAAAHFRDLRLNPEAVIIGPGFEDLGPRILPGFRTDYGHARRTFRFGEPSFLDSLVSIEPDPGRDPCECGAPRSALRAPDVAASQDGMAAIDPRAPGPFAMYRNLRTLVDLCRARSGVSRVLIGTLPVPAEAPAAQYAADWNRIAAMVAEECAVELVSLESGAERIENTFVPSKQSHDAWAEIFSNRLVPPQ